MVVQVLYLDLVKNVGHDKLMALAAATRRHFLGAGLLDGGDDRPFTAHITVAKLSNLIKGNWRKHQGMPRTIPEVRSYMSSCMQHGAVKGTYLVPKGP